MIDVNSAEYDRRYAADMREIALEEAIAKALCDACYGVGAWDRISARPADAVGQIDGWKKQARAALKVVKDWT